MIHSLETGVGINININPVRGGFGSSCELLAVASERAISPPEVVHSMRRRGAEIK